MSTGAFGYVNLLKSAADASWTREEVLTNNIANVDTPNYKRQDHTSTYCLLCQSIIRDNKI